MADVVSLVGGNAGASHHGRNTCSALIKTLYKVLMGDLKHFLTHVGPATGKPSKCTARNQNRFA